MRRCLLLAALWLLLALTQARTKPHNQKGNPRQGKRRRTGQGRAGGERSRPLNRTRNHEEQISIYNLIPGKQGQCVYQGLTMFEQAVWSPKPCVRCLCSKGQVLCEELTCPQTTCHFPFTPPGQCCPRCWEEPGVDVSGESPVLNDPGEPVTLLTHEELQHLQWLAEEEQRKQERVRRKEEEKRKRRKQRKEQAGQQRKLLEERRRQEEEALRLKVEREEQEWRRQMEEEERRRQEEDRKQREAAEREAKEQERKLEEEVMREMLLREKLLALEEDEEQEEEVWLRGDVFQMLPDEPEEEEPDLLPKPIPRPPASGEDEDQAKVLVLPPGCDISDVTLTCENARLTYFPPLAIPGLKSLSLEGNNISSIPEQAFNGIPNLEWVNLGKNHLTSPGIAANAFRGLKLLSRLYLDGNLLEAVPSDFPPSLQELKINENRLRELNDRSFHGLSSLEVLELEGNLLSEGAVDPLAFAPLTKLSYLRLGRNHFRTVPQGLPRMLLELYLENNLIEEISDNVFNQTDSLNVVSLRHNRLDETRIAPLAWFNHRNLESIDLSHNDLYLVPSYLPRSLIHLVLVGNNIERIPGYVFAHMDPGLEYLYLSYNKLDGEGIEPESFFGSYHSMVELCVDHNQLVTVPIGINEMNNLHFLRLDSNNIRTVPDDSICDPHYHGDSTLVALRLENNYMDPLKVSPAAFSCARSSSSVVLKPQKTK